jgi:serine protease AprX
MQKQFLLIILLAFCSLQAFAQTPGKLTKALERKLAKAETTEELIVWIYFTDKGENIPQKLADAQQSISSRALARRQKSMKGKAPISELDIPVAAEYKATLQPFLNSIRHESKWLNAISVKVKKNNLDEIAAFDFVEKIDLVRTGKRDNVAIEKVDNNTPTKLETPQSALYNLDYGLSLTQVEQIGVPIVHDLGYSGQGIMICLMDAGFRNISTLPIFSNMDVLATYDFVNNDSNVDDEATDMGTGSHGTATLSTIGGFLEGTLIGPAYSATYLLAKTENTESETVVEEDNWVAAAEWAEGLGVDITSTSLGYFNFDDGEFYSPEELDGNTATITIAGDLLASMGVLVVNSAGNSGDGVTTIGAPSDGNEVFAIGAVTADGTKSGFSSVGPTGDGRIKPDVMAMGSAVRVASWNGTFNNGSGTSFSCPIAAGAAALLMEMVPTATNLEIMDALRNTASNAATPDNQIGWGIINLFAAFEYLTFVDQQAPTAVCNAMQLELDENGMVTVDAALLGEGSTDNVAIASYAIDNNTFTCNDLGNQTYVLTVTDVSGNVSTCEETLTIVDPLPPVPNLAVLPEVFSECAVVALDPPFAIDNCLGSMIATTTANLPIAGPNPTTIEWTFEDNSGNTFVQTQLIIVNDTTPPVVFTQDILLDLNGAPSVTITPDQIDNGSTDNCSIFSRVLDISTFTVPGVYTVLLNVVDGNQNLTTGAAVVTVIDSSISSTDDLFGSPVLVYPNPAQDKVLIDFNSNSSFGGTGTTTKAAVRFYSLTGKMILELRDYMAGTPIAVDYLPNGLYVVQLESGGKSVYVKLALAK